jgi:predicted nucleotidyltransferase
LAKATSFVKRARAKAASLGLSLAGAYLVGSRARGDYLADSDVDLVLVLRGVKGLDPIERLRIFVDLLEPGVELRVYDVEEWEGEDGAWMKLLRGEAVRLDAF